VTYFVLFPLFVAQYTDDDMVEFTGTTQLPNFSAIEHTPERKQVFIDTLLPLIERKNRSQLKARNAILKLQMQVIAGQDLSEKQYRLLDKMRDRFRVGHDMYPDTAKALDILLLRADVIPTSMAREARRRNQGVAAAAADTHREEVARQRRGQRTADEDAAVRDAHHRVGLEALLHLHRQRLHLEVEVGPRELARRRRLVGAIGTVGNRLGVEVRWAGGAAARGGFSNAWAGRRLAAGGFLSRRHRHFV
jgi:hypothetical protein